MAVTIHQEPQLYTPSDNPVVWTFSSDQIAQDNFSFFVELYINGALDSRHIVFPEFENYAHFDAIERTTALSQKATLENILIKDSASTIEVSIIVYEKYGDPATLQGSDTSSTINAFKACLSEQEFSGYDYTDYLSGSSSKLFMTEFDRDSFYLPLSRDFYLSIITNEVARTLNIDYYNSSGALVFNETAAISNTIKIAQINLNSTLIADTPDTAYFEVSLKPALGVKVSETITINRLTLEDCDVESHLIWLNKFGSFDQYTFTHNKTETTDIKRQSFGRQFGGWNGTTYEFNTFDSGQQDYLTEMTDGGEIVSKPLTEDLQHSVITLYESPFKVVQDGSTTYQGITIKNTSSVKEQSRFNDLFSEVVNYSLNNKRKSPRL